MAEPRVVSTSAGYPGMLAWFIGFFSLTLLTLLDVRRGVLFAEYPVRTFFYVVTPWHIPMLALGSIASGRLAVDWLGAFGVTGWGRPFAQATSFLLNVWHATLLGVLLSGLALTVLPVYLASYVTRGGFTESMFGAMFALPQPFCSCCSSVMAPSFVRRGASTTFLLSFIIGAPMLNVTTIAAGRRMAARRSAAAIPGCRAPLGRCDDRRNCGGSAVPVAVSLRHTVCRIRRRLE